MLGMVAALLHRYSVSSSVEEVTSSSSGEPAEKKLQKLLLCAPSNAAVDELLLRLSKGVTDSNGNIRQLKIVRLGEPLEGSASNANIIQAMTLEAQVEALIRTDPMWAKLQEIQPLIDSLDTQIHDKHTLLGQENCLNGVKPNANSEVQPLNEKSNNSLSLERGIKDLRTQFSAQRDMRFKLERALDKLRAFHKTNILNEADIVAATLSGISDAYIIECGEKLVWCNYRKWETAVSEPHREGRSRFRHLHHRRGRSVYRGK